MKVYVPMHILCITAFPAWLLINTRYVNALSIRRRFVRKPHHHQEFNPLPLSPGEKLTDVHEDVSFNAVSPSGRQKRRSKRGFRRAKRRDFRLNYKDIEDDFTQEQETKRLRRVLSKVMSLRREKHLLDGAVVLDDSISKNNNEMLHIDFNEIDVSFPGDASESPQPKQSAVASSKANKSIIKRKKPRVVVSNIHELHEAILDKGFQLSEIELNYSPPASLQTSNSSATFHHLNDKDSLENSTNDNLFSHDVLNLLHMRYHSHSTPANRSSFDNATLALAIEGGGMRGAVSGGMAAAIVCLGLSNAFDKIYGSSAGSIIGSYFVSRQLYLDVYTDVIPAGFDLFVSKAKIIGDMFRNLFLVMRGGSWKRLNGLLLERFKLPRGEEVATLKPTREGGLNISFVLDSIMCPDRGLRPLDLEAFAHNDEVQPLRIVSSAVEMKTGRLKSVVFGSEEGHFCDSFANLKNSGIGTNSTALYPEIQSAQADDQGYRRGLWACLGASMSVPGAAGSPFPMNLPTGNGTGTTRHLCFDAFCYEPVPFRSAVNEGCTHVLALRSRPAGFEPKTKPTLYERAVAPWYFRSNNAETVAQFFEKGGQQYLYAEDVLLCNQGLEAKGPIPIPPAEVLYGGPEVNSDDARDRSSWRKAHLLPITVPADVSELGTLEDDRDEILAGIRSGFAAAYDALAPVVGLETNSELNGMKVAELVFPNVGAPLDNVALQLLPGVKVNKNSKTNEKAETNNSEPNRREKIKGWLLSHRSFLANRQLILPDFLRRSNPDRRLSSVAKSSDHEEIVGEPMSDPSAVMSFLPAIQHGSVPLVTERLQMYMEKDDINTE